MHALTRRLCLLTPLAAAACSWRRVDSAPRDMAPPRYDHLTPLKLNVAVLDIDVAYVPGPGDLGPRAPTPPVAALRQMAQDRLGALGSTGRATFSIRQASISRARGGYDGVMAVRLDVQGADPASQGFAEARVARRNSGDEEERTALFDMVRQMMEQMNVEFEFQVRRNLRPFLLAADAQAPAATGGAVTRQDLAPPPPRR